MDRAGGGAKPRAMSGPQSYLSLTPHQVWGDVASSDWSPLATEGLMLCATGSASCWLWATAKQLRDKVRARQLLSATGSVQEKGPLCAGGSAHSTPERPRGFQGHSEPQYLIGELVLICR